MRRRGAIALALAVAAVAAAALVGLGRWERDRYAAEAAARMAAVADVVGPSIVDSSISDTYSAGPGTCFTYAVGKRIHAIALCFDRTGRLIETTDARGSTASFDTIRFESEVGRVRTDPEEMRRALRLLDRRTVVTLVAGTAIGSVRSCIAWSKQAAHADRALALKYTGAAERTCKRSAAALAELVRGAQRSPLVDEELVRALQAAERVVAATAGRIDVAGRRFFGILRRREAVGVAYRTARRDAAAPLAAFHAARRGVARRP